MSGCAVNMDAPCVSKNVFNMTMSFLHEKSGLCGGRLDVKALDQHYLFSERQKVPGYFQEFWLGLYSSPEVRDFTWFWYHFREGWRIHRWGDQQYYFLVNALFSPDANNTLRIGRKDLICTWDFAGTRSQCHVD
jgi:hypothetical protein